MKRPQHKPQHSPPLESATCTICGEVLAASPQAQLLHLLFEHPIDFARSEAGQNILFNISKELSGFAENLVYKIRGKS